MLKIVFSHLTANQVRQQQETFVSVYTDAFSPPPYSKTASEITAFAETLPKATKRSGFVALCAFDDDSLVGFSWGYQPKSGQALYDATVRQVPDLASTWLYDCFQVAEMAVLCRYQSKGIGGQLLEGLVASAGQSNAILATFSAETAARRLYKRQGWQTLIESLDVPDLARSYCVMGKRLRSLRLPEQRR